MVEESFTPEEVAKILKIDPETVRRKLREGEYKGIQVGRRWRIKESELNRIQNEGSQIDQRVSLFQRELLNLRDSASTIEEKELYETVLILFEQIFEKSK